ncbi:MAG: TIGR00730 family Rossman fold protein [Hyphomicrobiaceae bacterium]|nr:TIGR00730 family Rossman fold protein [Hyphomicrobiaceae bacterium]
MQKSTTKPRRSQPAKGSTSIANVCVYCGSNSGNNPAYTEAAQVLGRTLAEAGVGLVYGGGGRGLMGETARSVLAAGGRVTGIIPSFLSEKEQMLREVNELVVVDDMHQRKQLMFERSDAFVALPGGIGTLEELVEQLTWAQLGRHTKPIVVANIVGCWDPFLALIRHMQGEGFIRRDMDVRFIVADRGEDIVPAILKAAKPHSKQADAKVIEKF